MMKSIMKVMTMLFIGLSILPGCKSPTEKVEAAKVNSVEAEKALEEANKEYTKEMDSYRAEAAAKIDMHNQMIADFRARVEQEKKSARAEYNLKIDELNQKNTDLKMKMDNYKVESKDKWETFKNEFNRDMDELGKALKDLTIKNNK